MRYNTIIIGLLLISIYTQAQEVLNIRKCIEIGLEKNFELKIARNQQEISDNNFTKGNAGYLPEINLNTGYAGGLKSNRQELRAGGSNSEYNALNQDINAGIALNWTIFDGFNIQAKYNSLGALQQKGELETQLAVENFVSDIVAEYYNYITQQIRLKNLQNAVALSQERVRIVEARYQIGSASHLDLQQAKVDLNADKSQYIRQKEVLFNSQLELNRLMAEENVEQQQSIPDSLILYSSILDKATLWNYTLSQNTSLKIGFKSISLSQLDLKMEKSYNYPYLKLNGGYGYTKNFYNKGTYEKQSNWGLNYGLTVGFNLYDGNNKKRKIRNAKIQIENTELQQKQLELNLQTDFSNIWMAFLNNMQLTELEKENLETAINYYEIAIDRYKLGDLSGIELREAQNSLLEARQRLIAAEYNTKICEISLYLISGQIMIYLQ